LYRYYLVSLFVISYVDVAQFNDFIKICTVLLYSLKAYSPTDDIVKFCYTWLLSCNQVIVFSSEGSSLAHRPDIPLIALPGIDDSYPPQHKSFAMLKYMHDHYRDKFRFFMRADDDVYIHGDVLGPFLHSINSSNRRLFIGQVLVMTIAAVWFN